ncbi:11167_t:CDS:2, partial [Scutellospora calospora]
NSTLFDPNIAESAHASVNREGTKLKLRTAIIKIEIHNQFSISKTNKDISIIQRKYNANKRRGKKITSIKNPKSKQRNAPIKKKAKTRIVSKNIEELSSNYAEGSKSVFSKEERELALKEKELDISIKEREDYFDSNEPKTSTDPIRKTIILGLRNGRLYMEQT